MSDRKPPETRDRYKFWIEIPTRWMDNDVYGHVNNVVYYSYFDTVSNRFLIDRGGLDYHNAPVIGLVIESGCRYHAPVEYPEPVEAGLRIGHLGRTSVRYEIGLFVAGRDESVADGHFVHVFVDRAERRPAEIPDRIRTAMTEIMAD